MSLRSISEAEPIRKFQEADWIPIYLAIGLTTLATLLLELSVTRLFSVLLYYHFAFLAISIAMFGLGVGGVLSYGLAKRKGSSFGVIGGILLLNAFLVVGGLLFILTRGGRLGIGTLFEFYFAATLPFLGVGVVMSIAISETVERVDRVYLSICSEPARVVWL